jgi:serine/threonine protein kinase
LPSVFLVQKIGKYSIVKPLGAGATSKVFLAIDNLSNREVALKLIDLKSMSDKTGAKAFKKLLQVEASLVGKLKHPNIVQMLDAVLDEDFSYIVLEYVNGGTLEQFADPARLLPFNAVAELMLQCCKALEYAQARGVIHRDIKPGNIMLQGGREIKISDFGAAMLEDGDSTMVIGVGSLSYMSPEQITGDELTHQTDIYSLGVTMSRLLTGRLPFQATSRHGMIYQIVSGEQQPPKMIRPEIPEALDDIVQRATHKDLSQRYQTWGEFARDLAAFLGGKTAAPVETKKFDSLRAMPFFENFSETELREMLQISKWQIASNGTPILKEGSMGNSFYILIEGAAKVIKGGKLVGYMRKGDCFGEIKRLPGSTYVRTTGVESDSDCVIFELGLDDLARASLECRFQFSEAFLHILMKRLEMANTRISKLLGAQVHY